MRRQLRARIPPLASTWTLPHTGTCPLSSGLTARPHLLASSSAMCPTVRLRAALTGHHLSPHLLLSGGQASG